MKKYEKIVDYIKKEIDVGHLKENDKLPNEEQLCQMFNVSRLTANKALNILQDENIIRRVRGSGSFISTFRYESNLVGPKSFNEQMDSLGIRPSKKLVDYKLFRGNNLPSLKDKMNINDDDFIHYIVRIFLANDIPIAVSYSYITPKYFKSVDLSRVENSLYEMLKEKGAKFSHADTQMTALMPTEEQKELLLISDEAMLKASTWLFDEDNDLIEYTEVYYVGSKYNYHIHINSKGEIYE